MIHQILSESTFNRWLPHRMRAAIEGGIGAIRRRLPGLLVRLRRLLRDSFPFPGALWVALATSLLCGMFLAAAVYWFAAGIGVLLAVAFVVPWLVLKGLRCHARFTTRHAVERGPLSLVLHVDNRWPMAIRGVELLASEATSDLAGDGCSTPLPPLAARVDNRLTITVPAHRRGIYPTLPLRVASAHPLGIHRFARAIGCSGCVRVRPLLVDLPSPLRRLGPTSLQDSASVSTTPGTEGEWLGVRPYRDGESIRHVHWPSSARQDQLQVLQRGTPRAREVSLVLDVHASALDTDPWQCPGEWAVRVAASLGKSFLDRGWTVRFSVGDQGWSVLPESRSWEQLLDLLAELDLASLPRPRVAGHGHLWTCVVHTQFPFRQEAYRADATVLVARDKTLVESTSGPTLVLSVDELRANLSTQEPLEP